MCARVSSRQVGNLTNVNYPATADLVFEYDALNRVVKDTRKGVITNTYTYHAGGQLATEATSQWASSTLTLGYTSRLRTSLTLAQPTIGNWTHSYTWDNARRLDTVTGSSGSFDYDYIAAATSGSYASRLVKKLTVPTTSAGPNITNVWDTTGRLTETKLVNGGTTFNRHAYVLNAAHQRTKQTRPDSTYVDYTYDDAGQLSTALSYTSGGSPITTEQLKYGYDAAQNLTKRTNNATVTSYSVNSLNQITADGGASWSHDHNGNRTYQPNGVGSYNYTYDDENQLVQAETDTSSTPTGSRWKTVWTYDARGRVRIREDYGWYAPGSYFLLSTTTRYLYDGMRVIQERNASNVPQVTYTRGLDLAGSWERAGGIGGLLARTAHSGANGVTYTPAFYHADGNGNVTYLLKLDQTMGATYAYDPYGRQLASSGTLANANTYRFSSKELMLASGFYYYLHRFYDPNTQRWLNRDPIQERGGINLYRAMRNNPVMRIDPLGLCNDPFAPWPDWPYPDDDLKPWDLTPPRAWHDPDNPGLENRPWYRDNNPNGLSQGGFVGDAFDGGLGMLCPTCADNLPKPLWDSAKASAANGAPTFAYGGSFGGGRGTWDAKLGIGQGGGDPRLDMSVSYRLGRFIGADWTIGAGLKDIGGNNDLGCDFKATWK